MVFIFFELNNLKVIHDLYSQCLTQTLFKITFFISTERVYIYSQLKMFNSTKAKIAFILGRKDYLIQQFV
jgi:hypothetical protein